MTDAVYGGENADEFIRRSLEVVRDAAGREIIQGFIQAWKAVKKP
jgi:hypothetical protein